MKQQMLRLNGARERDPAIEGWLDAHPGELGDMARLWFEVMRGCGDEVRELLHDGCPVACLGDVPFASVNVYRAHANVAFFQGAALADPGRLLEGTGRFMRHVKLRLGSQIDEVALRRLIEAAFSDMKRRLEHG